MLQEPNQHRQEEHRVYHENADPIYEAPVRM